MMFWLIMSGIYLTLGAISAALFWKSGKDYKGWQRALTHVLHVVAWPIGFVGVMQLLRAATKVDSNDGRETESVAPCCNDDSSEADRNISCGC
jgi:hypothetical protein